ncbi:hypothetical protein JCM11641_007785, partial [Rhodosporidiobolus odoratus]
EGRRAISVKWVLLIKRDADGKIIKYKARLVARGDQQVSGLDYDETFSSTVRLATVRLVFALLAANPHWSYRQFDISNAYLLGVLDQEIYLKQPPGFADPNRPNAVRRLRKALYGLKQGGREWQMVLRGALEQLGFERCESDHGLYVRRKEGKVVIVPTHVDDGNVVGDDDLGKVMEELSERLEGKLKEVETGLFLGMRVKRMEDGSVELDQGHYTRSVLDRFFPDGLSPIATPLESDYSSISPASEDERCSRPYRELLGALVYLSACTRPDLAFSLSFASRFAACPAERHWNLLTRICRYLSGTSHLGLRYCTPQSPFTASLLSAHCDADHAGDRETRRSVSGYVFCIGDDSLRATAISWLSRRQRSVAISSTEAEYMALSEAAREALWLRALLTDLGYPPSSPTLIRGDNSGSLLLASHPTSHSRTKHISVHYHFTRDLVEDGTLILKWIPTEEMTADVFTKGLSKAKHFLFTARLPVAPVLSGLILVICKGASTKRATSIPPPPEIVPSPLTVPALFGDEQTPSTALVDSGAQADVLSPALVHQMGLRVRRLVAPIHADLAGDGQQVRLSLFASTSVKVGSILKNPRSFFVCPLPPGVDAILGVRWLRDTGTAVSASRLFFAPTGPSEDVFDFDTGRSFDQPPRNFADLGFVDQQMTAEEATRFALCALSAGVPPSLVHDFVDSIEFEPHNPLLDIDDDNPDSEDLTEEAARAQLADLLSEFDDIFVDELPGPPPFRPVNHDIPLLDAEKKIRPHAIRIPDRYAAQWSAHLRKFVETGFWSPAALDSACAMFAVPKHDKSQARFVINLKPRNDNTAKLASPIPDMKQTRYRVASHRRQTKLDFKGAYEQVRLNTASVPLSGFVTPNGTVISHVMQQGDTNAPETMHRVCYMMFSKAIGRFLDVFYDDVLVYSNTFRAHLRYLRIIFTSLRHYRFYLSRSKVEFMTSSMEVLGAVVDEEGVHVTSEKWDAIQKWPEPRNAKDILRFMGTLQWMADHLPRLNEIAAPLTRLAGHVPWDWSPSAALSFSLLKSLIPETLIPLNLAAVKGGTDRLFLFTDASVFGCGGWIGQGPSRDTARPFRYFSCKFNSAQRNYTTTDQELLAVFVGCRKMHDHLVGWHFTVVCDHEPLKTWLTQPPKQSRRHVRLWESLAEYGFDWEFIPGKENTLANALSRLAELEEDGTITDIPFAPEPEPSHNDPSPFPSSLTTRAQVVLASLSVALDTAEPSPVFLFPFSAPSSPTIISTLPETFLSALRLSLPADPVVGKVMSDVESFTGVVLEKGLLFRKEEEGLRLVVPRGEFLRDDERRSTLVETVVDRCHELVGHLGAVKTLARALGGKSAVGKPYGFLHPLDPPARWWSKVGMDFVVGLPVVLHHGAPVDSILTVTDYLSKMVVLIPLSSTATALSVAKSFHSSVLRRFGLPATIVSDRDPKFTSSFWRALNARIGTSLAMSTAAHPQTDSRAKVTNKTVGTILRIFCEDQPDDWATKLVACEFAINSAPSAATTLALFEVVHGFLPSAWPAGSWDSQGDLGAEGHAERARLYALQATDAIIASRIAMTAQENCHRRKDIGVFEVGGHTFLSTAGLQFPASLSSKFVPKYVGPFPITSANVSTSTYTLALPPHLRLHPRFHSSKLRPAFPNDSSLFPHRSFDSPPPVIPASDAAEAEYLIEKIVSDRVVRGKRVFLVRYLGYSASEDQWRPEAELRATAKESLEAYLALTAVRKQGAKSAGRKKAPVVATFSSKLNASFSGGKSATWSPLHHSRFPR